MLPIKILDGAMGSELIRRGVHLPPYIWSAESNLIHKELVYQIHYDYVCAGSDYITTNTFRTTPRAFQKIGLTYNESRKKALESLQSAIALAKKAATPEVKVLGSIAPLEDCYSPEIKIEQKIALKEYSQIAEWMVAENIDGFLLETMNSIKETKACLEAVNKFDIPIWVSYYLSDPFHLNSGELLTEGIALAEKFCVDSLLLNCNPLNRTDQALKTISKIWNGKWGIYPNLGIGDPTHDGNIKQKYSKDVFITTIKKAVDLGACIIGGCCGSTPEHIELLKKSN